MKNRAFAASSFDDRIWRSSCVESARIEALMVGANRLLRGENHDQDPRRRPAARVVPACPARDRVRHLRFDAAVPGHRHRRWRRRRVLVRRWIAQHVIGESASRFTARQGGLRPPAVAVLLLVALVAAVAPASAQERSPSHSTSVYRRPLGTEPATLDPARIADIYGRSVAQQIFDGLVEFDQTLTIAPALAQYWKASRDGLTWTFTLRKGVRFHNGREVTADDVVFSLSRLVDPKV